MANDEVARILAVAGTQHGVLTSAQAGAAGVSPSQIARLVRAGAIDRPDVGILRVTGSPRTWEQDLQIALLRVGPEGAVSHASAARVWQIEGFERARLELAVPLGHRRRPRVGRVHVVRALDPVDVTRRLGLRHTTPERTLVDVAGRVDEPTVEVALDDLLRRRLTTVERVHDTAARLARKGRAGPRSLLRLLEARAELDGLTDTGFETRLLRILRLAGLPIPTTQFVLRDADGRVVARFDAAYVDAKVGIEADSERWHMDRRRFVADRTRRALAESMGWRVLAFTHRHVTAEQAFVARTVERTLAVAEAA